MRTSIICASLSLAFLTGPAWGADDNITSNARREEGECIGVVRGLTAAALTQGLDLAMRQAKGTYRKSDPNPLFCVPLNTTNGQVVAS